MEHRALLAAAIAVPLLATSAGCASDPGGPARGVAERFYAAVQGGQGRQACALLVPRAAEGLGDDCASAILGLGLRGGAVRDVAVWGDSAQVRMDQDTVFLHRLPSGWRVGAAGCTPLPGRPYDCEVER